MKPDFVTEEQWENINPTKRESIVALAATLFRMGFTNQQSFIYANEIDKAQLLIKHAHFNFEDLYQDWVKLGFHPLASDLLQTLLFGKLFKSIIEAAHRHCEDIINSDSPVRETWKHITWDFPQEYCPCCFSKAQADDPIEKKNSFFVHTRCTELYPEIIKYLCNLCYKEALFFVENKTNIVNIQSAEQNDIQKNEEMLEIKKEVNFEDLLPEEINYLDVF